MSRILIAFVLVALLAPAALARDEAAKPDLEAMERQIALEHRKIELDQRRAEIERQNASWEREVEFESRQRELELEKQKLHLEQMRRQIHGGGGGGPAVIILFVLFVVHILSAVWVYTDIRARNAGSGLWIVLSLFTGLFGALVYGVVRLGDGKKEEPADEKGGGSKK